MLKLWPIVLLLLETGCAPSPSAALTRLPDTGQPALHAVQESQLRELMLAMNGLMFENIRTQLDIDKERRLRATQIAESADALAKTVDALPSTLPRLNLNAAEQQTFLALTGKLHDQTALLAKQARGNQIDAMAETWNQVTSTCSTCHGLYRRVHR